MAWAMLEYERTTWSKLFPPGQPGDHWYESLWRKLNCQSWRRFKEQPITIVSFNYDRSLEHYLTSVVCNNYSLRPRTALAGLPIVHVHGTLGEYRPETYGETFDTQAVHEGAESIRVVHEANIEHSSFERAREVIETAERVLFVGLGYLDSNMRKLGFPLGAQLNERLVLGTQVGLTQASWDEVRRRYGFRQPMAHSLSSNMAEYLV